MENQFPTTIRSGLASTTQPPLKRLSDRLVGIALGLGYRARDHA
jgi:hypothetical protein